MNLYFAETEWMTQALCAQVDTELHYPEQGASTRDAKRTCAACPVRLECLDYALTHDERFGIWGGLTEGERRVLTGRKARGPQRKDRCSRGHLFTEENTRLRPNGWRICRTCEVQRKRRERKVA